MYEWDEEKREWTLETRGLDFADMDRFDWETAIVSEDVRTEYGETRYVALGLMGATLVAICFTPRGRSIRIISLRKASRKERRDYDDTQA